MRAGSWQNCDAKSLLKPVQKEALPKPIIFLVPVKFAKSNLQPLLALGKKKYGHLPMSFYLGKGNGGIGAKCSVLIRDHKALGMIHEYVMRPLSHQTYHSQVIYYTIHLGERPINLFIFQMLQSNDRRYQ